MHSLLAHRRSIWLIAIFGLLVALLAPLATASGARASTHPEGAASLVLPLDDDDDEIEAMVWIDDVEVSESAEAATFTVSKLGRTEKRIEIEVSTSDIEAEAGLDYEGTKETISLPKRRVVSRTVTVPIIDDIVDEDAETFAVTLSHPDGVLVAKDVGIGTIFDNADQAGVQVDAGDGILIEEGGDTDSFTVRLLSEPASNVLFSIVPDTAQLTAEPTEFIFGPTNWNEAQTVTVTAVEDGVNEDSPHQSSIGFDLKSADSKYDGLAVPPLIATIVDGDPDPVYLLGVSAGIPGQELSFSVDPAVGSGTSTYAWTALFGGSTFAEGTAPTFKFTPTQGGQYTVTVEIEDATLGDSTHTVEAIVLGDIASNIFVNDIIWLADKKITLGCNPPVNDAFCPDKRVTRGQMAAFLVRFLGLTDDGGGNTFIDDDDSVFENDIAKLAAAGITSGCNPPESTKFCPGRQITRAEMAGFLTRALGLTDNGGGNLFIDDDIWIFEDDIDKLATAGITRGCNPPDNDMFCPGDLVTRGQMAAFLRRAESLIP